MPAQTIECPTCNGRGTITHQRGPMWWQKTIHTCSRCWGSGRIVPTPPQPRRSLNEAAHKLHRH